MYNPLTCSGWEGGAAGWFSSGACFKSKIGFVLLFFLLAIMRKWGGEEMGISFNFFLSLVCGLVPYLFVIILFGSFKIALIVGIIGGLAGGYGGGLLGGDETY